jgi:hypothetical protein
MAAPIYSTDLTTIDQAQGTASALWAEPTDASWSGGGSPAQDVDYPYIQTGTGSYHSVLQATTKSGLAGLFVDCGASGVSLPTDGAFLLWQLMYSPTLIESYANGGLRAMVGSGLGAFTWWAVGGNNVGRNPYGGWQNHAINPTVAGGTNVGSPSGTYRYVGVAANLTAGIGKGYPHIVDVARYGRCEARFLSGEASTPATFAGFAASNDATTARWGLISVAPGGYTWKGLMTIGYGGSTCYFEVADTLVFVEDQKKVTSGFNKIEVRNSSTFNLTNVTIQALGTASKGSYETISGTATLDGCSFVDMNSFVFGSNDELTGVTFQRCGQVTQGGSSIDGCLFANGSGEVSLVVNSIASVTNCDFISAGTGHAIQGFSVGGSYDISSLLFTGYAASDGSSGNEAIYVTAISGENVTLNYSGTEPSVRTAGAYVVKQTSQITLTITPIIESSDVVIYEAGTTTILQSSQNIEGTSVQYIYSGGDIGSLVDVGVFKTGYIPLYVRDYELGDASASLPISQEVDRFYIA